MQVTCLHSIMMLSIIFHNYTVIDCLLVFQLLGFFAGIHLAILAAYVCRRHPNASINTLLSLFFDIFVHWPWPLPVSLLDPPVLCGGPDGSSLMPIMLPCIPQEFCSSSTTESTFSKIKEELRRGYALTKVQLFLLGFYLIDAFFLPERLVPFLCFHYGTMLEFNIQIARMRRCRVEET